MSTGEAIFAICACIILLAGLGYCINELDKDLRSGWGNTDGRL